MIRGVQMDYREYLSSGSWRNNPVRQRELQAAGFQCRLCTNSAANGHALECHHRTYERLGQEVDGDLTALCRACHTGVTSMLRARRYAASPITTSDYVPPIADPPPLFDQSATGASE